MTEEQLPKGSFQQLTQEYYNLYKNLLQKNTFDKLVVNFNAEVCPRNHKLINSPNTEVVYKLKASPKMCNEFGVVHGGFLASAVDFLTTVAGAAYTKDHEEHFLSVQLHLDYLRSAPKGKEFFVLCEMNKLGKALLFTTARIFDEKFKLSYTGSHTMFRFRTDNKRPKL